MFTLKEEFSLVSETIQEFKDTYILKKAYVRVGLPHDKHHEGYPWNAHDIDEPSAAYSYPLYRNKLPLRHIQPRPMAPILRQGNGVAGGQA